MGKSIYEGEERVLREKGGRQVQAELGEGRKGETWWAGITAGEELNWQAYACLSKSMCACSAGVQIKNQKQSACMFSRYKERTSHYHHHAFMSLASYTRQGKDIGDR